MLNVAITIQHRIIIPQMMLQHADCGMCLSEIYHMSILVWAPYLLPAPYYQHYRSLY
jgi:hypothetical protein